MKACIPDSAFRIHHSAFGACLPRRIAAAMSLIAFAVCLVAGLEADNPLGTILARSLVAMAGTLVVGLVVGAMAQKMLDEHLATTRQAGGQPGAGKGTAETVARKEPRA
jgi:hypothetical protein